MYYLLIYYITAIGLSFWFSNFSQTLKNLRGACFLIGMLIVPLVLFFGNLILKIPLDILSKLIFIFSIIGCLFPLIYLRNHKINYRIIIHPVYIIFPCLLAYFSIIGFADYYPNSWDEFDQYIQVAKRVIFFKAVQGNINPFEGTTFSPGYYLSLAYPELVYSREFSYRYMIYYPVLLGIGVMSLIYDFIICQNLFSKIVTQWTGWIFILVLMALENTGLGLTNVFFPQNLMTEPFLSMLFISFPLILFLIFKKEIPLFPAFIFVCILLISGILLKKAYITWVPSTFILLFFILLKKKLELNSIRKKLYWCFAVLIIIFVISIVIFNIEIVIEYLFYPDKYNIASRMIDQFTTNLWTSNILINILILFSFSGLFLSLFTIELALIPISIFSSFLIYCLGILIHYTGMGGGSHNVEILHGLSRFFLVPIRGFWIIGGLSLLLVISNQRLLLKSICALNQYKVVGEGIEKKIRQRRILSKDYIPGYYLPCFFLILSFFLTIIIFQNLEKSYKNPRQYFDRSIKEEVNELTKLLERKELVGEWVYYIAQGGSDSVGNISKLHAWANISDERKNKLFRAKKYNHTFYDWDFDPGWKAYCSNCESDLTKDDFWAFRVLGQGSFGATKKDHWMTKSTPKYVHDLLLKHKIMWIVRTDPWIDPILESITNPESCLPPYNQYFMIKNKQDHFDCYPKDSQRKTCDIYQKQGFTEDGVYKLDPDGRGPIPSFDAYCDMKTDNGGWTLVIGIDGKDKFHTKTEEHSPINLLQPFGKGKFNDTWIRALGNGQIYRFECGTGEKNKFYVKDYIFNADKNLRDQYKFSFNFTHNAKDWMSASTRVAKSWAGIDNYEWAVKNDYDRFFAYSTSSGCEFGGKNNLDGRVWVK